MDAQTMLDYMGIMLDTEKLADTSFTIRLKLTDGEDYFLKLQDVYKRQAENVNDGRKEERCVPNCRADK